MDEKQAVFLEVSNNGRRGLIPLKASIFGEFGIYAFDSVVVGVLLFSREIVEFAIYPIVKNIDVRGIVVASYVLTDILIVMGIVGSFGPGSNWLF